MFISDAFFPDWIGGLQRYATELTNEISNRQIPVSVYTRIWSDTGRQSIQQSLPAARVCAILPFLPKRVRGTLLTAMALAGVPLHRFRKDEVRIVHTSILGNLFMSGRGTSTQVFVFHASPSLELRTRTESNGESGFVTSARITILRRLEISCLRKADAVVVLSNFSQRILLQEYPWLPADRVRIIPGGSKTVGIGVLPRRSFQSKRLIAVRRLEWRTGIDLLIHAFAQSNVAAQGWTLDIVGTGSLLAELTALADRLGVRDNIVFHGVVTEEQKSDLLSASQMFILPTRAFEGFGLATVEAMAHGLVPIATSAGASPEIVEQLDPKLICEPTAEGLSTALAHWVRDENQELIAALSARAIDVALSYDWGVVADCYLDVVESIRSGRA